MAGPALKILKSVYPAFSVTGQNRAIKKPELMLSLQQKITHYYVITESEKQQRQKERG